MKLLDKHTKAILDAYSIEIIQDKEIKVKFTAKSGYPDSYTFKSLEELNNTLEDYKPAIEDKRVRKFVRDWADMNGISKIIVFDKSNSPYIPAGQVVFAENAGHLRICFKTDEKFDTDRIYSVPELCGEEKTCES